MTDWDWQLDGWIIAVGMVSACSCALLGNYLILRKMSLMGDAISHAVLPGVAVAFVISNSRASAPMFIGAVIVGALTALLTEVIRRHGKVEHGAAMGVVFSILFAAGLILIRRAADHVDLDPDCVLYGNLVLSFLDDVSLGGLRVPRALLTIGAVLIANLLFVGLFYKELKICAFDPALATSLGINASVMHYALMVMVAITTVANFEAVGSILVIAMLIVPGAAAYLLTDRLGLMLVLSVVIATSSAVFGHLLAIRAPGWVGFDPAVSVNTAAMMAAVAGLILMLAFVFSPAHGLVSKLYFRWVLSLQIVRENILGLLYRWDEMSPSHGAPMLRSQVLSAVGHNLLSKWALRSLHGRREVRSAPHTAGAPAIKLTDRGALQAAQLVRAHRLWEAYLAKYFDLPVDHLHMPAERTEHFISADMRDTLSRQLTDPVHDPHGAAIPRDDA